VTHDNSINSIDKTKHSAIEQPEALVELTIDATGLRCPLPLLRAKQALRSLPDGALLEVITNDSASKRDFQAYAKISGHGLERCSEQAGEFTYWLRKVALTHLD
jgi:TusA-related sulfurtransferase